MCLWGTPYWDQFSRCTFAICNWPFFTIMMLASQVKYLTSLMKLSLRSLFTSSLAALCCSSPIFLFSDTGLVWGQMTSLWHIKLGWIPGMSNGCQANKFAFLCSTSAISQCWWLVRSLLSYVHCLGSSPSYSLISSSMGFRPLSEVSLHGSISSSSSKLAW